MKLTAVPDLTVDQDAEYTVIITNLRDKLGDNHRRLDADVLFDGYSQKHGYGHYIATGTVSMAILAGLGRLPTELEISMIVDNGYAHFGGYCMLEGRKFTCKICTD